MGRKTLSSDLGSYRRLADTAASRGSATYAGEERQRKGQGLHPLVDPKGNGLIRRSLSWLEQRDGHLELLRGVAMLVEGLGDTTGSMGHNVDIFMRVLPQTYNLLADPNTGVLRRYDPQMITAIFGDVVDEVVLCRSEAEMDARIAEQMTYMMPCRAGGDSTEDPQYGLFAAAYLTECSAERYGLRTYHFTTTDAPARDRVVADQMDRIFGPDVYTKVTENGHQRITRNHLPRTKEIVEDLQLRAHAFLLLVGRHPETRHSWSRVYDAAHTVELPHVEYLPQVQAAIIGLTEGVIDLQSLSDYLRVAGLPRELVPAMAHSISGIPIGAQAALPNFDKVPLKGAQFAKKGDIWPIGTTNSASAPVVDAPVILDDDSGSDGMWL